MHQQPIAIATPVSQQRQLSSRPRGKRGKKTKKKVDPNAPLINEHLVAELFNQKKRETVTAETYQVRLIIDQGFNAKPNGEADAESDGEESDSNSAPQLVSLSEAMATAHDLALDLMEVTLKAEVPVIKAVDFDSWLYKQRRKEKEVSSKRKKEGGGAISDRQLKEFKFRAGIADHDLQRKASKKVMQKRSWQRPIFLLPAHSLQKSRKMIALNALGAGRPPGWRPLRIWPPF